MKDENISSVVSNWKHWLVYTTLTFLSIFVFAEFALSASLYSLVAPSSFMFYFTPVGLFFGESMVSLFATVLLFLGLFFILRFRVYVKKENSLKFNRSDAYKLLPFYLTVIISLAIYISMIPLELSNIVTYVVFILLFESFVEHSQISGYGQWLSDFIKKSAVEETPEVDIKTQELTSLTEEAPEKEKIDEVEIPAVEEMDEDVDKTHVVIKKRVKKVKKPAEYHIECPLCGTKIPEGAETDKCPDCGEPLIEDELPDIFEKHEEKSVRSDIEKELDEELTHIEEELEECPMCGAKLQEGAGNCPICYHLIYETDEETGVAEEIILNQCPLCLADITDDAVKCPECGEPLIEDELPDVFEKHEGKSVRSDIEKELDEELIHIEEELEECPICGTKVQEGGESCPECDQLFYEIDGASDELLDELSMELKLEDLKDLSEEETYFAEEIIPDQCPLCLADITDDAVKCPECGEPLIEEEEEDDFFKDIEQ